MSRFTLLALCIPLVVTGCQTDIASAAPDSTQPAPIVLSSTRIAVDGTPRDSLNPARFFSRVPGQNSGTKPLALTGFTVRATSSEAGIRSRLSIEIENTNKLDVEAVIRLPIPPGAAVTESILYVGDQPMLGAFVQRDRAQQIYDRVVSRRRDPLLAVWSGPEWLDITIFPVAATSKRRFELEWIEPVTGTQSSTYRIPLLAHRGRVIGKPTVVAIDGTRRSNNIDRLPLPAPKSTLIASRAPGDPFGYAMLRTSPQVTARASIVLIADTSSQMKEDARRRQREQLSRLLAGLPDSARVTLLSVDWLRRTIARGAGASDIRAKLVTLDDIPSAGALDIGQALRTAVDEAVAIDASAIVYLGDGQSRFTKPIPAEVLRRLQQRDIALHVIGGQRMSRAIKDLAWLSGGRVSTDGALSIAKLLRPRLADKPRDSRVERWYPLRTVTGDLVWMGRFVGDMPHGATRTTADDLRALWGRANPAADASPKQRGERPYKVITPMTSLLVLETDADYERWGIPNPRKTSTDQPPTRLNAPTELADTRGSSPGANTARPAKQSGVLGSLSEVSAANVVGKGAGKGGGGTGWGTIGHGSGTGSGYGIGSGSGIGSRRVGRRGRPPQVRIGKPRVSGSLDKNIIRRYIRRKLPRIRYCYEKQLLTTPGLSGRISVNFTIAATGRVPVAQANGMSQPAVGQCVAGVIRTIQFPRPAGGGTIIVSYPFKFRPGDSSEAAIAYVNPWVEALKIYRTKGLKALLADSQMMRGAPQTTSVETLGWWLVTERLRMGYVPLDGYILATSLLRKAGQTLDARRVLSEGAAINGSAAGAVFKKWRQYKDAKRLHMLLSR